MVSFGKLFQGLKKSKNTEESVKTAPEEERKVKIKPLEAEAASETDTSSLENTGIRPTLKQTRHFFLTIRQYKPQDVKRLQELVNETEVSFVILAITPTNKEKEEEAHIEGYIQTTKPFYIGELARFINLKSAVSQNKCHITNTVSNWRYNLIRVTRMLLPHLDLHNHQQRMHLVNHPAEFEAFYLQVTSLQSERFYMTGTPIESQAQQVSQSVLQRPFAPEAKVLITEADESNVFKTPANTAEIIHKIAKVYEVEEEKEVKVQPKIAVTDLITSPQLPTAPDIVTPKIGALDSAEKTIKVCTDFCRRLVISGQDRLQINNKWQEFYNRLSATQKRWVWRVVQNKLKPSQNQPKEAQQVRAQKKKPLKKAKEKENVPDFEGMWRKVFHYSNLEKLRNIITGPTRMKRGRGLVYCYLVKGKVRYVGLVANNFNLKSFKKPLPADYVSKVKKAILQAYQQGDLKISTKLVNNAQLEKYKEKIIRQYQKHNKLWNCEHNDYFQEADLEVMSI